MGGVIYMKEKIIAFVKKETVLVVAAILAVISAFFVHPDQAYIDYIDFRVLGILLSLMIIMAGVQNNGIFDEIGRRLLAHTKNTAQLAFVLVFLCFFSSMVITNDVALLTFVPFALLTLQKCGQERLMVPVIVLQTIAANLGSMLTPIGNPQNLYLYNLSEMNAGEFLVLMLPYTVVSGVLLALTIFVLSARKRKIRLTVCQSDFSFSCPDDFRFKCKKKKNQIDRLSFFGRKKGNEQKTDRHVCGFIPYGAFGRGKDPAVLYFACGGGCVCVFIR